MNTTSTQAAAWLKEFESTQQQCGCNGKEKAEEQSKDVERSSVEKSSCHNSQFTLDTPVSVRLPHSGKELKQII